jgi:hypothetical protein
MDQLPKRALYSSDIRKLARQLKIPNFVGVRMRDQLNGRVGRYECGIVNLDTTSGSGSHWICYYCNDNDRYFFDSFAEPPPLELLRYLKSPSEFNMPIIKRNAKTVQHDETSECGSLCLYVLKQLSLGRKFPDIIEFLNRRYQGKLD